MFGTSTGRAKTLALGWVRLIRLASPCAGFEPCVPPKRLIHDETIWPGSTLGRLKLEHFQDEGRCRDMAQTRRMGMPNDWTQLRIAPRFSPYRKAPIPI